MRTEKFVAFPLIASGMLLVVAGAVCKHYALFDEIANLSLPYLFGMLGVSALVVGAQCALFGCTVRQLPILPNTLLFLVVAAAANINVLWDGVAFEYERSRVLLNLADSVEFTVYYALFLFLPRWSPKSRVETGLSGRRSSDS